MERLVSLWRGRVGGKRVGPQTATQQCQQRTAQPVSLLPVFTVVFYQKHIHMLNPQCYDAFILSLCLVRQCNRIPDERRFALPLKSVYMRQIDHMVGLFWTRGCSRWQWHPQGVEHTPPSGGHISRDIRWKSSLLRKPAGKQMLKPTWDSSLITGRIQPGEQPHSWKSRHHEETVWVTLEWRCGEKSESLGVDSGMCGYTLRVWMHIWGYSWAVNHNIVLMGTVPSCHTHVRCIFYLKISLFTWWLVPLSSWSTSLHLWFLNIRAAH